MTRFAALILLSTACAVPGFSQEETPAPPAGDGEVQLQTETLDLLPWYVSVQGFAHVRKMGCTVTLAGNQGIAIKGGTAEERGLLVKVATVFEAEGAGGSAPQERGYASAEQVAAGLYARRTDFASVVEAQAAFPRVRELVASPLPGVRGLQLFLVGQRLVVLGESELTVYLVGGVADAVKASQPVREPLADWKTECEALAARYEAEGDAAYDWAFGGHMQHGDPLKDAQTSLAVAAASARAIELYDQAHSMRASIGLEAPESDRATVIAQRLQTLPAQTAGFYTEAADALEAVGDAAAAEAARECAKALGGE